MIKNGIERTNERISKFAVADKGALIQIKSIGEFSVRQRPLSSFGLPGNMKGYLDYRLGLFLDYWDKRKDLDDDMIPAISSWYGIAEHTAFIGGEADFGDQTSWHHPFILDWSDRKKASLDENNTWLRLVVDGILYLREKAKGRYAVKLRGAEGAMDIANIARGNEMFYDFYEYPEELCEFLDFCAGAARFTLEKQTEAAGRYMDGVITGFDIWLPGNSTGHLSEDASVMISPEQFREFALPYTNKITNGYDHVFMHTHSVGVHNIPEIIKIDNLDYVEISNDPNAERSMAVYRKLESELAGMTVVVSADLEEIRDNLEFLASRKSVIWYDAKTTADAEEAIAMARSIG
ncbi:MAG: hypothetical protein JXB33_08365 [Clostridia bacterium]|nr:hypothetical protein [Clostridia bacterium]